MKNRIQKENRNKDVNSKWNKCKQFSKNEVNWLSVFVQFEFSSFPFLYIFGIVMEVKCHFRNHCDCRKKQNELLCGRKFICFDFLVDIFHCQLDLNA